MKNTFLVSIFIALIAQSNWALAQGAATSPVASGAGELTAAKRAEIKLLLDITGIRAIPDQIAVNTVQSMVPGIRQLDPKFPEKGFQIMHGAVLEGLKAKVDVPGGLIEQVTLVYHNAFSASEISDLVKFHQSASGKKMLAMQGKVNNETMQAAMKWADSHGVELEQKMEVALKKENLKLPDPPKTGAAPAAPKAPAAASPKAPAKPAEAPPAKK